MTDVKDIATLPVNFIHFHGITLLVVQNAGIDYIEARPLCELAGMDWKSARRTLERGDNAVLYGTRALLPPQIGLSRGSSTPQETVYIRLDRGRLFLARVSTERMRSQGNDDAATMLLKLQVEWAEALHAYETHGVAVKASHRESRAELIALFKSRSLAETAGERQALTALIRKAFQAMGEPVPEEPQGALDL